MVGFMVSKRGANIHSVTAETVNFRKNEIDSGAPRSPKVQHKDAGFQVVGCTAA